MTKLSDFQSEWTAKINQQLISDLTCASRDNDFAEMMKYAVLNGGKRLRPMLVLAVIASFGKEITPSMLKAATAVEWVHSYSLVHDDLPAMDNDMLRRGKPSVHALYGEAEAILVGDALLTGAFHVLSTANDSAKQDQRINAEELLLLSKMLSFQAGGSGMVIGQMQDMKNHGEKFQVDDEWLLSEVYAPKTAALLSFSALAGSRLAHQNMVDEDGSEELVQNRFNTNAAIFNFGYNFGIAFQIQDDLDDFDQDDDEKIMSLPHLIGKQEAINKRDEYIASAHQDLADISAHDSQFNRALLDDFLNLIGDRV